MNISEIVDILDAFIDAVFTVLVIFACIKYLFSQDIIDGNIFYVYCMRGYAFNDYVTIICIR